ncbi:MAG: tRNA (adenosine(37)-N6)-threonylcarbamoyltransferase complex ATPase subunit type 1 TsaE [Clostridiales bacterium]|nr:tRNA (adenosine(37)-N6)-threonylcarbamoyltransferase complex ATPase subunit type 1 TsaE [Clostridiales bacterium]
MEFVSKSVSETEKTGETFSKQLQTGDVVALYGTLGVGKTAFVRGVARGLSVKDRVTSPTFAIVNEYKGDLKLYHFDVYRLQSSDELFDIGWEDYLNAKGVIIVEWSELIEDALPGKRYNIRFDAVDDITRIIHIESKEEPK